MLKDFLKIFKDFCVIITANINSINSISISISISVSITATARLLLFISISPARHSLNITIIPLFPEALRASVSDPKAKDDNCINFKTKAPLRGLWCG